MKQVLVMILLSFATFVFSQTTIYDDTKIFGDYTLVTGQDYPTYNNVPSESYNTNVGTNARSMSSPRRASGDIVARGSQVYNGVTVTWYITEEVSVFIGSIYTIHYSDGTTETVSGWSWNNPLTKAKQQADETAKKKAIEQAQAVPIGNGIGIYIALGMIFVVLKYCKG